jgi:hypothetical protein
VDASAEFDCGVLPACAPTCAGPVRRVLAPLAHTSGCAAEGLAHAAALRAVLVLTVFVAANAARDAAVRGRGVHSSTSQLNMSHSGQWGVLCPIYDEF